MKVSLTFDQAQEACRIGCGRRLRAVQKGRRDNKGYRSADPTAHPFEHDVTGAAAEYAAALGLGVPWDGGTVPDREKGDLQLKDGPLDVRSTQWPNGSLLIHETDLDDRRFLLVTGSVPNFVLRGWAWGHEAVRPEWLKTYKNRTSYWMPQAFLRPVETLV